MLSRLHAALALGLLVNGASGVRRVVESSAELESDGDCAAAVPGSVRRTGAVFYSKKCTCPNDSVITGTDFACVGDTGVEKLFNAQDLAGKGCSCKVVPSTVGQGQDGNPKGWNRYRRCDGVGYDPPCGPCEGVGGPVWGDKIEDIRLTPCKLVTPKDQVDPSTLKHPLWGSNFSVHKSHEIMIGKKNDPACFQSFPYNDSSQISCYKPQDVAIYSDMLTYKAIRVDSNQAGNAWGLIGNVSSVIYHQGRYMWIINRLPLGIHQTVCVAIHEGGDHSKPPVYPVQYNWTDRLTFVARESVAVEYGVGELTLDHWVFGPHHAWTDPQTGAIIRMWQPFNGLQIFEPGTYQQGAPPALFADLSVDGKTAPKEARKGGSTFRIGCNDDGFPTVTEKDIKASLMDLAAKPAGHQQASVADLKRARTKVPRKEYKGDGFSEMSETLNAWLMKHAPNSKDCDKWTVQELQQLQVQLMTLRDPNLDAVYQNSSDNRQLRQEDLQAMKQEWDELNALAASDPQLQKAHRDGHCHEAVMWYVHHVPESLKEGLKDKVSLPLLSYMQHDAQQVDPSSLSATKVMRSYQYKVTCALCHSNVLPGQ